MQTCRNLTTHKHSFEKCMSMCLWVEPKVRIKVKRFSFSWTLDLVTPTMIKGRCDSLVNQARSQDLKIYVIMHQMKARSCFVPLYWARLRSLVELGDQVGWFDHSNWFQWKNSLKMSKHELMDHFGLLEAEMYINILKRTLMKYKSTKSTKNQGNDSQ